MKTEQRQRIIKRNWQHKEMREETIVMILMMWDLTLYPTIRAVADQLCGFRAQTNEVASHDNNLVDAHANLGTSTKPD